MGAQEGRSGREVTAIQIQGLTNRDYASSGALVSELSASSPAEGPVATRGASGLARPFSSLASKLKAVVVDTEGSKAGLSSRSWAEGVNSPNLGGLEGLKRADPALLPQALSQGLLEEACLLECNSSRSVRLLATEPLAAWDTEDFRKQQTKTNFLATNRALKEEALRYGLFFLL